jgi:hypothetical protein
LGLGARIELFGLPLLSWKSVSFTSLPVSPRWWNVLFSQDCSWAFFSQAGLAQHSAPHLLDRGKTFPPFIRPADLLAGVFVCVCVIYLPAVLEYVVPSRADDMSHSPGWVAVTLGGIASAPGWLRQRAIPDMCPLITVGPGRLRCLRNSFHSSLCLCFCQ